MSAVLPALPAKLSTRHERIATALAAIHDGKSLTEVAHEHGITPSAMSHFLLTNVPDEYKAARECGLTAKLAECGEGIETASSHLHVARARETARFWCWVSERLLPRFAAKQEVGAPGEFKALEDGELARRYAFIRSMAQRNTIDVEPIASSGENHNP